jgi:hypothetical protein
MIPVASKALLYPFRGFAAGRVFGINQHDARNEGTVCRKLDQPVLGPIGITSDEYPHGHGASSKRG